MVDLGEIVRLPIREVFPNEEYDFTKHFEDSKNLSKLGDVLGISLDLVETESRVGRYEADILARSGDKNVIIENQYGYSDFEHFGKLMTYGMGKDADILIWIVESARDEHKMLISELNKKSNLSLFMVEVKTFIVIDPKTKEKSMPCVDYDVIVRPNEFSKELEESNKNEIRRFKPFWNRFLLLCKEDKEFSSTFSPFSPNKGVLGLKSNIKNSKRNLWFTMFLNMKEFKTSIITVKDFYDSKLHGLYEKLNNNACIEKDYSESKIYYAENSEYRKSDEYAMFFSLYFDLKNESTWDAVIKKQIKNLISIKNELEKELI